MKILFKILRWTFGLILCIVSIGGFASGDNGLALFVLTIGLFLIPPISNKLFKTKKTNNDNTKPFNSNLKNISFPERIDDIVWHINAIERGLLAKDFNLVNLSYAKLIESIRQQNINDKINFDDALKQITDEYSEFRQRTKLEYPSQFLPPSLRTKQNNDDLINVTSKSTESNSMELTFEINEDVLFNRLKNGPSDFEDNETFIDDITGFYGTNEYSPNKKYCVSYCDGYYDNDKWKNGDLALLKNNTLLFKKKISRPNDCFVSNDGVVVCCDWLNSDTPSGIFLIFDSSGNKIFNKKTTANLSSCSISEDSKYAIYETHYSETDDSNMISIIDVQNSKLINKFKAPISFNSALIESDKKIITLIDHRAFELKISFDGVTLNNIEYENQIMTKGSIHDKLSLFTEKSDEENFKNTSYLETLKKALLDEDATYSFGLDRIYRLIGEFHEANGNIPLTIENWEKAVSINPNVGIKRKLNAIKKR